MKNRVRAILLCLQLAAAGVAGTAHAQNATPGGEWLSYNNGLHGQRYSPLKQIDATNAATLGQLCRVQIDGPGSFHGGLIVQGDTIYTGTPRETVALDATTCALRWKFEYRPEEGQCGGSSRGVALLDGRIFRGTCDGRLIALDAATGRLLWKNVIAMPTLGESTTAAPLAWQGVVYMGIGGSELGARGRVLAFDAATGRELWRFNTIPLGSETGADTWKRPESAKTGGGGVWGAMSLDVANGELFVPVGNPWPDIDKDYRPGDNLFTNSVVVLDARTGALKWWHQISPGDWMDLDLVAAPVLPREDTRPRRHQRQGWACHRRGPRYAPARVPYCRDHRGTGPGRAHPRRSAHVPGICRRRGVERARTRPVEQQPDRGCSGYLLHREAGHHRVLAGWRELRRHG